MGKIDQDTVNRILDAADIVEVVSDFVKLRRSGANYKGLCPFHNERTPSFSVNKSRNICKCFSCGKGGSPVNFIMEHEQLSYTEALRYLARKYNIEIVEKEQSAEERQQQNDREAMLAVNDFALSKFRSNLLDTPEGRDIALPYFRHRGLSDAMIERFKLGYSIDKGSALLDAAREAGFNEKYLLETGLAGKSEREGRTSLYDRFRGRVMFPILSISGRVVGFGGRTMRSDKTIAKYVNSPESLIYKKNLELYGLYQAKSAIAKRDKVILVEGYLDVISMHQAGVENVVASSGTSLTEGQIRAVRRFTENVTLIYDADQAGIKASLRGINMLLAEKLNVKVLLLPPGDDPDSFAQSHSSSEVERYLAENERDIIAFMTDVLMKDVPANDPTARAKVVNVILQSVAHVDEAVKRQEYISQCSRMLGIAEEVLVNQLNVLITGRYVEDEKNRAREDARRSIEGIEKEEGEQKKEAGPEAPLINLDNNKLRPYEEMLARYLVRYGLLSIPVKTDDSDAAQYIPVVDVISSQLDIDGITLSYAPYAAVFDAVKELRNSSWPAEHARRETEIDAEAAALLEEEREKIRRKGGSIDQLAKLDAEAQMQRDAFRRRAIDEFDVQWCQNKLSNTPDDDVRRTAVELMVDRYTLSKIYTKQGVSTEQDQLGTLVPRAIIELRNAIVADIIADLTRRLATEGAADPARAMEIISRISEYKDFQRRLAEILGDRIILPKQR